MARRASNVSVPDVLVVDDADCHPEGPSLPLASLPESPPGIVIPTAEDSIRGAMTMAIWAIPRMDPWMDLLTASFSSNAKRLESRRSSCRGKLVAFPSLVTDGKVPRNDRSRRTRAPLGRRHGSVRVSRRPAPKRCSGSDHPSGSAMHRLPEYGASHRDLVSNHPSDAACGRRGFDMTTGGKCPSASQFNWCSRVRNLPSSRHGCATRMCRSLLPWHGRRPRYAVFSTATEGWTPAFAVSSLQQEVIAVQALRACSATSVPQWPGMTNDEPKWCRDKNSGDFVLTWSGQELPGKREKDRGKWFASDFDDPTVQRDAVAVAKRFDWPCVSRVVKLNAGATPLGWSWIDRKR